MTPNYSILQGRMKFIFLYGILLSSCSYPIQIRYESSSRAVSDFSNLIVKIGVTCVSEGSLLSSYGRYKGCGNFHLNLIRKSLSRYTTPSMLYNYLIGQGATCRKIHKKNICNIEKSITSTPLVHGEKINPSRHDKFEFTIQFSANEGDFDTDSTILSLKRFSQTGSD